MVTGNGSRVVISHLDECENLPSDTYSAGISLPNPERSEPSDDERLGGPGPCGTARQAFRIAANLRPCHVKRSSVRPWPRPPRSISHLYSR